MVADAGHMVNDAAALTLAAGAGWLARRPASSRHSYGLGRTEFLAALVNSAALLALVALRRPRVMKDKTIKGIRLD
jgi:cobalt-zinc-cadmium efflux system protein